MPLDKRPLYVTKPDSAHYMSIERACFKKLITCAKPLTERKEDHFSDKMLHFPIELATIRAWDVVYFKDAPEYYERRLSSQLKIVGFLNKLVDDPKADTKHVRRKEWLAADVNYLYSDLYAKRSLLTESDISSEGRKLYLTYVSKVTATCIRQVVNDFVKRAVWTFPEQEDEIYRVTGIQKPAPTPITASKVTFFTPADSKKNTVPLREEKQSNRC